MKVRILLESRVLVSWSMWLYVWRDWSKTILIRTTRQHKPCADCERYQEELRRAISIGDRALISHAYQNHLSGQMRDRRVAAMIEQCSVDFFAAQG